MLKKSISFVVAIACFNALMATDTESAVIDTILESYNEFPDTDQGPIREAIAIIIHKSKDKAALKNLKSVKAAFAGHMDELDKAPAAAAPSLPQEIQTILNTKGKGREIMAATKDILVFYGKNNKGIADGIRAASGDSRLAK